MGGSADHTGATAKPDGAGARGAGERIPTKHDRITVTESDAEVEAKFEDRRWVFPREDCILLPIENTTAERIAHWIGCQLREDLRRQQNVQIESIRIEVEENFGQWAVCELPMPDAD